MTRTSNVVSSGYTVTNYNTYKESGIQHIKVRIDCTVAPGSATDGYFTIGFSPETPAQLEMFNGVYVHSNVVYPAIFRILSNKNIQIYVSPEISALGNSSGNAYFETSFLIQA